MSSPSDERPKLAPEDEDFVKRVAASYAPPPMTPAERAAFDEALLGRIRRGLPARRWLTAAWLPAAAAVALAAVSAVAAVSAIWLVYGWPGSDELVPPDENVPVLSARDWEEELFLGGGSFQSFESGESFEWEQPDDSELLPEEYIAIASIFLDG